MDSSTPIRLTKQKQKEISVDFTPIAQQEDEVERRNRRSLAGIQKRLSTGPIQGSPALNSSISIDIEEVKEHFKLCQKLFAENKINNKNAWNLKLIDYFKVLVTQEVFGKDTMVIAATSLDICTKVYACRVDDLYEKGLKLANTISSLERKQVDLDERNDDSDVEERGEKDNAPKKKKKVKRLLAGQKHTIAKDSKMLQLSNLPKIATTFFTGHINIEATTGENLFTNKLPLDHVGHKIILLDKINRGMTYYGEEDPSLKRDNELSFSLSVNGFKICQPFVGFHVDEWDPDQEENQIASLDKSREKANATVNNELVYDEQGIPVAELDGSVHDIFADDVANDDIVEEFEAANVERANHEIQFIASFCPNENGYAVSKELDPWWLQRMWIGPSHWKNKFLKQRASRFTGKVINELPSKSRKKAKVVLTTIEYEEPVTPPIDFTKKYKSLRKMKHDISKCTWPPKYLAVVPDQRLLITKHLIPNRDYQAKPNEEEYEHSPYDYNNPNDSQYCSQHSIHDEPDDNNEPLLDNIELTHQEDHIANCGRDITRGLDMLENLVEAPDMVQQTYIPYALRAKKINMKRLKNTMWEILTEEKNSNTMINIEEKPAKDMDLTHLYQILPSRLPETMCKELSIHLEFVALLHLTNEHNLKLTAQKDLCDIRIQQDKQTRKKT